MYIQFQKACRRKVNKDEQKILRLEAIAHLRQFNITENNQKDFFDKYVSHLNNHFLDRNESEKHENVDFESKMSMPMSSAPVSPS